MIFSAQNATPPPQLSWKAPTLELSCGTAPRRPRASSASSADGRGGGTQLTTTTRREPRARPPRPARLRAARSQLVCLYTTDRSERLLALDRVASRSNHWALLRPIRLPSGSSTLVEGKTRSSHRIEAKAAQREFSVRRGAVQRREQCQ